MDAMEKLGSLAKRRGFIFPSSEIYGGLNGCWDYGPLGVELKRNIKEVWWQDMISHHDNTLVAANAPAPFSMVGLDSAILMNPRVWEASGHVGGFNDPMVDCRETRNRYRADQLVVFGLTAADTTDNEINTAELLFASPGEIGITPKETLVAPHRKRITKLAKVLGDYQIVPVPDALLNEALRAKTLAPGATEPGTLTTPRAFNLMFKTHVGALESSSNVAYLRPETAQGIFMNFKNVCDTSRVKIPFGIGQIGKAFRNEINPRNFIFRSREFEQMEIEFFCREEQASAWYQYWRDRRYKWYVDLGLDPTKLRLREHSSEELAHYAAACADVEYAFPFGVSELEGIANRTDFDLRQHADSSGKDLRYFDDQEPNEKNRRFLPYVIEPSAGADRATLAFLCDAYSEDEVGGEMRTVLKFHPRLAPIKAAVFPLTKKGGLPERALALYRNLRSQMTTLYDEKGNIGRRYRRQDEAGTPFCITIDSETLSDETVTIRDRDTCEQIRIPMVDVLDHITERLKG